MGGRVRLTSLQRRWDLNGRAGRLIQKLNDNGRWQVQLDNGVHCVSAQERNLVAVPSAVHSIAVMPLDGRVRRSHLQRLDMKVLRMAAALGPPALTDPLLRPQFENLGRARQRFLYEWGVLPKYPHQCYNLAIGPTLAFALQTIAFVPENVKSFRVHCVGATEDFEARADWVPLPELFRAAGLVLPEHTEITYVGVASGFNLGPDADVFTKVPMPPTTMNITVRKYHGLYHEMELEVPHVVVLCHPGFDAYTQDWYPTMRKIIEQGATTVVTGHSNFYKLTHDAAHLQAHLNFFGAHTLSPVAWNPFAQVYDDITKGSLLAAAGQDHTHANMACLVVVRGGEPKTLREVEEGFDCMDYLAVSVGAFHPMCARGPWHRTGLRLEYPNMTPALRQVATDLMKEISCGALPIASAADLRSLFQQRGLEAHFQLGRGKW